MSVAVPKRFSSLKLSASMAMSNSISSKLYQGDVVRPRRPLLPRHVVAVAAETMRTSGSAAPAVRLARPWSAFRQATPVKRCPEVVGRRAEAASRLVDRPGGDRGVQQADEEPRPGNCRSSQRDGAAIDSFGWLIEIEGDDARAACRRARVPVQGGLGTRCTGGTVLSGRPRAFHAPGRTPRRSGGGLRFARRGGGPSGDHRASCRICPRRASKGHWIPAEDEVKSGGTVAGAPEVNHFLRKPFEA